MSKRKGISRRRFVGDATAAGLSFTIVPRHVLGRGYLAPSDKLNVGCVGGGGRAKDDIAGVSATENIYAIADPDWDNAGESFAKFPQAKKYKDYREMLDKEKSIDAVVVACPDHSHTPAALMALRLGKHVYCEKPLCRTLGEVRALMKAAAERPKLATQMGNQGHAGDGIRLIREWVEAGLIGTVREVHFWTDRPIWPQAIDRPLQEYYVPATLDWNLWLGPAPERPYNPAYEPFNWRGWWDFGTGALGDMACHIMDAAFWTLDLGSPTRAIAETTEQFKETAPKSSRVEYHFAAKGSRAPVTCVWRDGSIYPPRPAEVPAGLPWPPSEDGGSYWIGDKGKLIAGTYGGNPQLLDPQAMAEVTAHPVPQKYPRVKSVYAEWIDAAKGNGKTGSSFDGYAGPLTSMVLLGDLAVRMAGAIDVNPATGDVTTSGIPAEWVTPVYRSGWSM